MFSNRIINEKNIKKTKLNHEGSLFSIKCGVRKYFLNQIISRIKKFLKNHRLKPFRKQSIFTKEIQSRLAS